MEKKDRWVIFDLDFTLLDASRRVEFARKSVERELDSAVCPDMQSSVRFRELIRSCIEDLDLLSLDIPYPGAEELLAVAHEQISLKVGLYTARQSRDSLEKQLAWLGWARYFDGLVCSGGKQKTSLDIRDEVGDIHLEVVVGDSEEDMRLAQSMDATFLCAVMRAVPGPTCISEQSAYQFSTLGEIESFLQQRYVI